MNKRIRKKKLDKEARFWTFDLRPRFRGKRRPLLDAFSTQLTYWFDLVACTRAELVPLRLPSNIGWWDPEGHACAEPVRP